jgi:hypothetical protein
MLHEISIIIALPFVVFISLVIGAFFTLAQSK